MNLCPTTCPTTAHAAPSAALPIRARRATRWLSRLSLVAVLALLATQSFASGTWTTKTPMLTGRSHFVLGEHNGILYAAGGFVGTTTPLASLEAYDPATNTWTWRTPMPTARHLAGGAFVDGILYVVGGYSFVTGQPITTVEAYDPATDTWTTKPPMLAARYGPGVVAVDGILYVVGGVGAGSACSSWGGGQSVLATVEAYDPSADSWSLKAPMPTARATVGAAAVDGVLYAVGGEGCGAGFRYATTEAYDPATNTWATLAPMSTARQGLAVVVLDGLVYAVGGSGPYPYPIFATVEAFDPVTGAWTAAPSMPTARYFHGAAVANGVIYAAGGTQYAGGSTDGWGLAVVEALAPAGNEAPAADAGPDQTLDATIPAGAEVTLDGTESVDLDGDALTFLWSAPAGVLMDDPTSATPTGMFPVGVHLVTLTVSDGHGGLDTDDVVIQVEDSVAPYASCTTDLAALWPPNHKLVDVQVRIVASDALSDPADIVLTSVRVTSDEADDAAGNGDGATTGDVSGSDGFDGAVDVTASFTFDAPTASFVGTLKLRAERSGTGDGRSYGIQAVVKDPSGNSTSTSCVVVVPHSRGR